MKNEIRITVADEEYGVLMTAADMQEISVAELVETIVIEAVGKYIDSDNKIHGTIGITDGGTDGEK